MYEHKNAEEIFSHNIGRKIKAEVINKEEPIVFEGMLTDIVCNQFFITNDSEEVNMFRYEDLRYLILI